MVVPAWIPQKEPDDQAIAAIIRNAGLREFRPMPFRGGQVEDPTKPVRRRKPPDMVRDKWIGPYYLEMTRRADT